MSKTAAPGSLAGYMSERARSRDENTSERFELPGFPAIEVELRVVDYKREHEIGEKNRKKAKHEADRVLYTAADVLQQAAVGFFVNDQAVTGGDNSWNGLCVSAYPEAVELSPRQAIIRLLTPDGVGLLFTRYVAWRADRVEEDGDEATEDLGVTP